MTEYAHLVKTTLALFAIVSPLGALPMFIASTRNWSKQERAKTARTVAFTVFIVLMVSAFLGEHILDFFGISIPSFQVGGGILLMLIATTDLERRNADAEKI